MPEKILIVDDEPDIVNLLDYHLTKEGYLTKTAQNGKEALDVAKDFQPDLVLLDLMMPEMDGFQVLRKVRELLQTPVIMLTARGEVFDRIVGLELGADDYLSKPFEPRELLARIQSVFGLLESFHRSISKAKLYHFMKL